MILRRFALAALFSLAALPIAHAGTTFSLSFNSTAESVISYEECRLKETQTVHYDCGSKLGIKLVIYASPSGACTNTPGTDAVILLSERIVSSASDCKGTISIDPGDVVGDDCPCQTTKSLQLCAATKYQAYNYETLLTEWVEDETVSAALTYDSKPPAAPVLGKVEPGDKSLYLTFSGPTDITEWVACVESTAPADEAAVIDDIAALIRASSGSEGGGEGEADGEALPDAADTTGTGEEDGTCEVGTSPFEGCAKLATFSGSGTTRGTVQGLVNGETYRVTLVGRDAAGNYSPVSEPLEGAPMDVQDFFEAYVEAGGSEEGGFGCASAGGGISSAGCLGLAALLVGLCRRRRTSRARAQGQAQEARE